MTRLESRFLVTRTRVESRWEKWWLDSTRVTFFIEWLDSTRVTFFIEWLDSSHSQWLETRVRVIFTKSLSSWLTNPLRVHLKKWAFFASVMIKIGTNFLFCLSSRSMLHFKDQAPQLASGVQDPDVGVQSGRILGIFWIWIALDIVFFSTGSGTGLSKWNKLWP